jgi:hypothetical protein
MPRELRQGLRSFVVGVGLAAVGCACAQAELRWSRTYPLGDTGEISRLVIDPQGGAYFAGAVGETDNPNLVVGRVDAWGLPRDVPRTWGTSEPDQALGLAVDGEGNMFVAGATAGALSGANHGRTDAFVAKLTGDGSTVWIRQFGGELDDGANGVAVTTAGIYVCGATVAESDGRSNLFVRGLDLAGGLQWQHEIGRDGLDSALDIVAGAAGSLYVGGYVSSNLGGAHSGGTDAFLMRVEASGEIRWQRQFGTSDNDGFTRLALGPSDTLYAVGYSSGALAGSSAGLSDPVAFALSTSTGDVLWQSQWGSAAMEYANGIHVDGAGNASVGTWSFTGGPRLVRFDSRHAKTDDFALAAGSRGTVRSVVGNGAGTVYAAGRDGDPLKGSAMIAKSFGQQKTLPEVPDYQWNYGCGPTAAGMIMGYWDRQGKSQLVGDADTVAPLSSAPQSVERPSREHRGADAYATGPPDSNAVVDALIASVGHHRDYWAHDLGPLKGADVDPKLANHNRDSLADYLETSYGRLANGSTDQTMLQFGLRRWAKDHGASGWYAGPNDTRPTFAKLRDDINNGAPVLLSVSLDGTGGDGHGVVAYGYVDFGPEDRWVAVRDTWNDGLSLGRRKVEARLDENGVEWWRWATRREGPRGVAYVTQMNSFGPGIVIRPKRRAAASDSFERFGGTGELVAGLGYEVDDASPDGSGSATIVASPLDPDNPVLQLRSPTGQPLTASVEIDLDEVLELSFDYLFADPGKLTLALADRPLAEVASPATGPGAPGATEFGAFAATWSLTDLGWERGTTQSLQFSLSAEGDPTLYLDNLQAAVRPAQIPEPCGALLGALACAALAMPRFARSISRSRLR